MHESSGFEHLKHISNVCLDSHRLVSKTTVCPEKKKNCILLPFSQWTELRAVLGFHFPCLIYNLTVRATSARKVTFREVYLENMK